MVRRLENVNLHPLAIISERLKMVVLGLGLVNYNLQNLQFYPICYGDNKTLQMNTRLILEHDICIEAKSHRPQNLDEQTWLVLGQECRGLGV